MVEIHTTIRNGLPVIARGRGYQRGFPQTWTDPAEPERYEEIELFWQGWRRADSIELMPCALEMTDDERDRIERELLEAGNEQG